MEFQEPVAHNFPPSGPSAILRKGDAPSEFGTMVDAAALLGTWNMTSWKREIIATGEKIDALGPDPVGFINYGSDGRFYALVVSRNRPKPARLPQTPFPLRIRYVSS
jgi:hypothetical protein